MGKGIYKLTKQYFGKDQAGKGKVLYKIKNGLNIEFYTNLNDKSTKIENKVVSKEYLKRYAKGEFKKNLSSQYLGKYENAFIFKTARIERWIDNDGALYSLNSSFHKRNKQMQTCGNGRTLLESSKPIGTVKYKKYSFYEGEKQILEARLKFYTAVNKSFVTFYKKMVEKEKPFEIKDLETLDFMEELNAARSAKAFTPAENSSVKTTKELLKMNLNPKREHVNFIVDILAKAYEEDLTKEQIIEELGKYSEEIKAWVWLEKPAVTEENADRIVGISKRGELKENNLRNIKQGSIVDENGQYQSKQEILNKLSVMEKTEFDKLVKETIENYDLKQLEKSVGSIIKQDDEEIIQLLILVKEHYKQVNKDVDWSNKSLEEKMLMSYMHEYVKGRAKKCIVKFGKKEKLSEHSEYVKNVFKESNVSEKAKISINNKIINNIMHIGRMETYFKNVDAKDITQNHLEQIKIYEKLLTAIASNVTLAGLALRNTYDVKYIDTKYSGENDILGTNKAIEKIIDDEKYYFDKLPKLQSDKNEHLNKTQMLEYYENSCRALVALRGNLVHDKPLNDRMKGLNQRGTTPIKKIKDILNNEISYYNSERINNLLTKCKSTGIIDAYGDKKTELENTMSNFTLEELRVTEYQRFSKIYNRMKKHNFITLPDIKDKENGEVIDVARRNLLQFIYNTFKHDTYEDSKFLTDAVKNYNEKIKIKAKEITENYSDRNLAEHKTENYEKKHRIYYDPEMKNTISTLFKCTQSHITKNVDPKEFSDIWNDFIAYLFDCYLDKTQKFDKDFVYYNKTNRYLLNRIAQDDLESTYKVTSEKLEEQLKNLSIDNVSPQLFILATLIDNRSLNKLIHAINKFNNSIEEFKKRVDFKGLIGKDAESLNDTVILLSSILENHKINNDAIDIKEFEFMFEEDFEYMDAEISINAQQKQKLYHAGEHQISFSELGSLNTYHLKPLFEKFYEKNKNFKISQYTIGEYENLFKKKEANNQIIKVFNEKVRIEKREYNKVARGKEEKFIDRLKDLENGNEYNTLKVEEFNKYKEAYKANNNFVYYKNQLKFTILLDMLNILIDGYAKLLEWVYRYERDEHYFQEGFKKLGFSEEEAKSRSRTLLNTEESEEIRNNIAHFAYLELDKLNSNVLHTAYSDVYKLFSYSAKYRADIYAQFVKLMDRHGIILADEDNLSKKEKTNYTKMPTINPNKDIHIKTLENFPNVSMISNKKAYVLCKFVFPLDGKVNFIEQGEFTKKGTKGTETGNVFSQLFNT